MPKLERHRILINGIVQGVGFRPFIYNLAHRFELTGTVSNTSQGVIIEAEGRPENILGFQRAVEVEAPPLSQIIEISDEPLNPAGDKDFIIISSDGNKAVGTLISPDIAVCDDCRRELLDPNDRRYRYPFINCTNCGPRYTIIEALPYDRPFTSMRTFQMCQACQAEYDDPANRRFHAQPNACPDCGPHLGLYTIDRQPVSADDRIAEAGKLLKNGKIIAIKGLGGFHLAVDAASPEAVIELRQRKNREEKPLAVMVKNLASARRLCVLTAAEEKLLVSPRAPIVLARKKVSVLAEEVAPGNDRLGIMLPYTPLHHLLLEERFTALVMTSANLSEEPICFTNDEAFERLYGIADFVLLHNRDIYLRGDDSVFIELGGKPQPIRRSRGYAPVPVLIKSEGQPVLAVGGELKNTICLLQNNRAFLSQHIGDLENLEAFKFFKMTIEHLQKVFQINPELVVYDMHPRYLSTQWAREQPLPALAVQHHHAHLAAALAEHNFDGPAIGLIMDGTGYGGDGTIWGGEVLLGDFSEFERFAAFEAMPLPGGDASIKAPWRTAVSYLQQAFEGTLPDLPFLESVDYQPVMEMVEKNINCFATSSCGRLFDAVAAIGGGRTTIRYEGQAAIEMMQAAGTAAAKPYKFAFEQQGDLMLMPVRSIIRSVTQSAITGADLTEIGQRFHRTLVDIFVNMAILAREKSRLTHIVLSGGVFQNQILFETVLSELEQRDFEVLTHQKVPANDGGISLGQALIGREWLRQK